MTEPGPAPRSTTAPGPTSAALRRDFLIAFALWIASMAVYHASPVTQVYDARYLTAVSHSLIEDGRFSLPPISQHWADYTLHGWGYEMFHWYPNAPAVLNVPLVFVFELLGVSVFEGAEFNHANETRVLRVAAAFATALTVALSYLLARIFLRRGRALAVSLVFAFGTSLYSSASRAFWSHSWGVALLTLALYLLLDPRFRDRRTAYLGAASALSWACFCRPTFLFSSVALTLFLLSSSRRRHLPVFVGAGVAWALVFVAYSYSVYGQTLPPYFAGGETPASGVSRHGLGFPTAEAAWGTLFSPGRGLFVYTPFLALVLLFLVRYWNRLPSKTLAAIGLGVLVAHWALLAGTRQWWGSCYGPRTFTDVVPWLFLFSVWVLAVVDVEPGSRLHGVARLWISVAAIAVAASLLIHTRGAVSDATMNWGSNDLNWALPRLRKQLFYQERLLNWRYPQFLAGLTPAPPPERFVSWLCEGGEEVRASCRKRLKLKLGGTPGTEFAVRLESGDGLSGRLGTDGSATLRTAVSSDRGRVTVLWTCGTVITEPYVCDSDRRR